MIISATRASSTKCWRRAFNLYHRNLSGEKNMNLVDGGAFHDGVAHGLATKDWAAARAVAFEAINKQVSEGTTSLLPDDMIAIRDHAEMVDAIIQLFESRVGNEPYVVVQPEAMVDVPIPQSNHNCIWLHWRKRTQGEHGFTKVVEMWSPPTPEDILHGHVLPAHHETDVNCPCYTPHRVVGRTDAIVSWEGCIWLLEHKTTAMLGDQFWAGFELDLQPTLYLWAIWQTLGIQPRGFILNAVKKPSEKQVAAWNERRRYGPPKAAKDYLDMERQAILRSTEDLLRAPAVMKDLCDEWEANILAGRFRPALDKTVCVMYGHRCEFHTACANHEAEGSFADLLPREQRYDDEKIAGLVQITREAAGVKI